MNSELTSNYWKSKAVSLSKQLRETSEGIRARKVELSRTVIALNRTWSALPEAERKTWVDQCPEVAASLDRMFGSDRTFADFQESHVKLLELLEQNDQVLLELIRKSKLLCSVLSAEMLAEMKFADMKRSAIARITRQLSIHGLSASDIAEFYPTVAQQLTLQYPDKLECSISQTVEARICLDLYDSEFDINFRIKSADTLDEIVRILAESILLAEIEATADEYRTQADETSQPDFQPSGVLRKVIEVIEVPELLKLWALLEAFCETQATTIDVSRIIAVEASVRNGASLPHALRSQIAGSKALMALIDEVVH